MTIATLVRGENPPPTSNQQPLPMVIQSGSMSIGPPLAQRILDEANYERQRPISRPAVKLAAEHILRNSWIDGHQIWFAMLDGRLHLADGQHRLTAIVETGRTKLFTVQIVPVQTMEDVHRLYHRLDRFGRRRTVAEMLNSAGVAEDQQLSKLMVAAAFKAAPMLADGFASKRYGTGGPLPTDDDKLDFLVTWWPEIRKFEALIGPAPHEVKRGLMNAGVLAVAMLTLRQQPGKAADFWSGVAMNDGLRRGDPRHTFVAYVSRHNMGRQGGEGCRGAAVAWNAYYEARNLTIIRVFGDSPMRLLGVRGLA